MGFLIDNVTSSLIVKSMESCLERQKVIAQNIANATVPDYKALKINDGQFQSLLQEISDGDRGNAEKLKEIDSIRVAEMLDVSISGVPVSLDTEMLGMFKNVTKYQSLLALKKGYSGLTDLAIKGDK